jgi:tRNA modification GTPase
MNDTITAIATPPGSGAIAVLRISGPEAIPLVDQLFQGNTRPSLMESRRSYCGTIVHEEHLLDEVLLTIFRAPKSYTGEDVVEISGHGGALIVARLLEATLSKGARLARPGEFTQRAYLHGKMDLTQAEAVMDLISSQTRHAQRIALAQRSGRLSQEIEKIKCELLTMVAHLEAFFDFPDEDIHPEEGALLRTRMESSRHHLVQLLDTAEEGRLVREGASLVLCGSPNVGKSSLFNKLLEMDRAIVSPTAGTTRDTIEEMTTLGGFPFRVIDTAGIRLTEDLIEREGVARAQRAVNNADDVLHLVDARDINQIIEPISKNELLIFNKVDLIANRDSLQKKFPSALMISCMTGEGMETLITTIIKRATGKKEECREATPSLLAINARHQACLSRALHSIDKAIVLESMREPLELLSIELHDALEAVGEVTGEVDSEEILGTIFSTFCIGK